MTPATLKATIEAADRATVRGAYGQALRLLLAAEPGPNAPDHDHTCPDCAGDWSHLDEPCGDVAVPMLCGHCEDEDDCKPERTVDLDP